MKTRCAIYIFDFKHIYKKEMLSSVNITQFVIPILYRLFLFIKFQEIIAFYMSFTARINQSRGQIIANSDNRSESSFNIFRYYDRVSFLKIIRRYTKQLVTQPIRSSFVMRMTTQPIRLTLVVPMTTKQ